MFIHNYFVLIIFTLRLIIIRLRCTFITLMIIRVNIKSYFSGSGGFWASIFITMFIGIAVFEIFRINNMNCL